MIKKALTIAGSDSSGGAGIQTDIKTFSALGIYAMSAITAITAQNTTGVFHIEDISKESVYEQIKACVTDIGVDAVKIGMLSNADIILSVKRALDEWNINNVVLDPVMVSTTGYMLIKDDAKNQLLNLFSKALIITPNKSEAEVISNIKINDIKSAILAAEKISKYTKAYILIKGIDKATDLLYKDGNYEVLKGIWVDNTNSHGTGCTLSSAIAAYLAKGLDPVLAIKKGKKFITKAIENGLEIGAGSGPTNPLCEVWSKLEDNND